MNNHQFERWKIISLKYDVHEYGDVPADDYDEWMSEFYFISSIQYKAEQL